MAVNSHIATRLAGIRSMLMGAHQAGSSMSTASRGSERAAFVDKFLCEVLTPQYRFGDGDATDSAGNRSGQLDVVVEYPWVPSLPVVGNNRPRLYLAEGIACVIEVKSDVASQWGEVMRTSSQLKKLERHFAAGVTMGYPPPKKIPLFAVGYEGWKTTEPVRQRLAEGGVDGILVIDSGIFLSSDAFMGLGVAGSEWALWGLISCLHIATSVVSSTAFGTPLKYCMP